MLAVIFEVEPAPGERDAYLAMLPRCVLRWRVSTASCRSSASKA